MLSYFTASSFGHPCISMSSGAFRYGTMVINGLRMCWASVLSSIVVKYPRRGIYDSTYG